MLHDDTPEWGRKLYERINNVKNNITASVDFIANDVAESLKDVGNVRLIHNEQ